MIKFRCWYCHALHEKKPTSIGKRFICTCERTLQIPKQSHGDSRYQSIGDRLITASIYGLGGAMLGFVPGIIAAQLIDGNAGITVLVSMITLGLIGGILLGERCINGIGRMLRLYEDRVGH